MSQKKKTGIMLGQDFRKQNGQRWLLSVVAVLLSCASLVCIFGEMTGYNGEHNLWIMLITGSMVCIGAGILEKMERQNLFYPIVLLFIVLLVLFFRQQILSGCCITWNRMGDAVTANTGWVIPEWEMEGVVLSVSGERVFFILVGILTALFSCLMHLYVPLGMVILSSLLLLVESLLFGQKVSLVCFLLIMGSGVFILFLWDRKKRREGGAVISSFLIFFLLFAVLFPISLLPGVKSSVEEWSNTVQERIHEYRYETTDRFLPEGDLSKKPVSGGTDRTALIVTADVPETMYLRGFTGAVLEDDKWLPLPTDILAENEELLYWLNLNGFYPDAQLEKAFAGEEVKTSSVSVQNVNACSKYLYIPFGMCTNAYLQPENLNQKGVLADGSRQYTFENIRDSAGIVPELLNRLLQEQSEAVKEYKEAESVYRKFVYEHYLAIPQEVANSMEELWKAAASLYENGRSLTSQEVQQCVLHVMEQCFPENGSLKGENLPVREVEGTSYQYATAAVMTLRYYGIPARYAEGFILTEEMAEKGAAGESIEVDGSCGAAWPEVYQDGIGWIPMALTPGMDEEIQKNQNSDKESLETVIKEGEELEEEPDKVPDEPESEGGSMVTVPQQMAGAVWKGIVIIFLIFTGLVIRRKILLEKRAKRFALDDCREAIGWIYADTSVLLGKMGFDRKNGSMETLYEPIREQLGEEYADAFCKMTHLNSRALFSSRPLTEEQKKQVLDFRNLTMEQLKSGTKWPKRIWMKWIQCLY